MAGYIGSKSSVTQVDGYTEAEADAEFVTKTGDTMSGNLNVTGTVTSDGLVVSAANPNIDVSATGTGVASQDFLTNSNAARTTIGVERSGGGGLFVGSSPYAAVFGSAGANPTQIASNNTVRMTVDTAGRVTMPYQPAFCTTGYTASFDGVTFKGTVLLNNGNYYSTSSGKFTAPVAGLYAFSFNLTTEDTNSHFTYISVNGGNANGYQLSYGVAYQTATQNIVVSLSAGDYVEGKRRATGYAVYKANFSGYLIG